MLTLEDAKRIVHKPKLAQGKQLLVILAITPAVPLSVSQVKERCIRTGLPKLAKKKNISDILASNRGAVARTHDGWELQEAGILHVQGLAQAAGVRLNEANSANNEANSANNDEVAGRSGPLIFISHRSKNVTLAALLVQLLSEALDIPKAQIRCTSVPGCRLGIGSNISDALRAEIASAGVFIFLLTPEVTESAFVMFEAGARWGLKQRIFPLLAPGGQLPAPIAGVHAAMTLNRADLHQFLEDIAAELKLKLVGAAAYDDLLTKLVQYSPAS